MQFALSPRLIHVAVCGSHMASFAVFYEALEYAERYRFEQVTLMQDGRTVTVPAGADMPAHDVIEDTLNGFTEQQKRQLAAGAAWPMLKARRVLRDAVAGDSEARRIVAEHGISLTA